MNETDDLGSCGRWRPRHPAPAPRDGRAMTTSADVYDHVAPYYATYRRWWTVLAGGGAERRLRRGLGRMLRPGMRVLDAGAGTGAMSRAVIARQPRVRVTMLDQSAGMLAQAGAVGGSRVQGGVDALPFMSGAFDLVVAAWVLETVADPGAAVREMLRVLSPEGHLLVVFSARPDRRLVARIWRPVERVIAAGFAGRFVPTGEIPFHECRESERRAQHLTPAGTVVLGRCCLDALTTAWSSAAEPG